VLDIRKAVSQSHVLPAAAVISTINFAFEISTDGVSVEPTSQEARELRTV